jgi:hypothetical protein
LAVELQNLIPAETLFFQASGLALPATQEIEPGPAHVGVPSHFDLFKARGMQGERSLHADSVCRHAPHSKVGIGACPLADAYDDATHQLDPLSVAFDDAEMDFYVVADAQVGKIGPEANVLLLLLLVK